MPEHKTRKKCMNAGVRLEDSWHAFRLRRARERGYIPTVLPFRGYGLSSADGGWVRVFARVVMAREGAFQDGQHRAKVIADGIRGWRNFVSPPVPHAELTARIDGRDYTIRADRGGVVDVRVTADLAPGWHTVQLSADGKAFASESVHVVDESASFGVISDIDDTVVVTALPRPLIAAWNSFVIDEHARLATPGMAVMMERVLRGRPETPVLYLSTGAWNAAQTLSRFLSRNLYPEGALLLTDWGPTEGRWFRSGMQHKVDQLRRLAAEFPNVKWLMFGDDGQHDPTIYAEFARRYPQNVQAIVIRQLTPSEAVLAGGRSQGLMDSTPGVPWIYAPDGGRIVRELETLGLLGPGQRDGGLWHPQQPTAGKEPL